MTTRTLTDHSAFAATAAAGATRVEYGAFAIASQRTR